MINSTHLYAATYIPEMTSKILLEMDEQEKIQIEKEEYVPPPSKLAQNLSTISKTSGYIALGSFLGTAIKNAPEPVKEGAALIFLGSFATTCVSRFSSLFTGNEYVNLTPARRNRLDAKIKDLKLKLLSEEVSEEEKKEIKQVRKEFKKFAIEIDYQLRKDREDYARRQKEDSMTWSI